MQTPALLGWLWGPWSRTGLGAALLALVVDQAHKWWMLNVFRIQEKGQVTVTPFLDLVFVRNTGISYSFGTDVFSQPALAAFAIVAAIVMVIWMARAATGWMMAVSIGLIVGGAIGNAIDRMHLGGVADFFRLHAFGYSWYVFNIADAAIVAGVIGLLYESIRPSRHGAANAP
jgi:signal peptidase II